MPCNNKESIREPLANTYASPFSSAFPRGCTISFRSWINVSLFYNSIWTNSKFTIFMWSNSMLWSLIAFTVKKLLLISTLNLTSASNHWKTSDLPKEQLPDTGWKLKLDKYTFVNKAEMPLLNYFQFPSISMYTLWSSYFSSFSSSSRTGWVYLPSYFPVSNLFAHLLLNSL